LSHDPVNPKSVQSRVPEAEDRAIFAPVFSCSLSLPGVVTGVVRTFGHAAVAPGGIGPRGVMIDFKTTITDAFTSYKRAMVLPPFVYASGYWPLLPAELSVPAGDRKSSDIFRMAPRAFAAGRSFLC
jgi:hypothetical protein